MASSKFTYAVNVKYKLDFEDLVQKNLKFVIFTYLNVNILDILAILHILYVYTFAYVRKHQIDFILLF